ncbi:hemicentin-2 [Cebidichthys violaceus]|uniref:hemicentin-2 n=1 Tax=Cebidichthys violaceus TaxID=271503 RepID=UPI0035CC6853
MGCSRLFILCFVLNVAHCLDTLDPGGERIVEITHNITAFLGEDVYLSCSYLGESEIQSAEWKRQVNSKNKFKRLAGFVHGKPFSRDYISEPDSLTNLTVKMEVSSVEAEGEYICEFESEEELYSDSVYLTVVARLDEVQVLVNAETINGSDYQSVSCSAVGGRPMPQISWLVAGRPPSDDTFSVDVSETVHSNGTSTLSSILRFPTHLQDEDSVTCVVQHPTLPVPKLTTVGVETYTRPNVSIKAEMVQRGGSEFWVVSCISSGGRPDADIALALNGDEELQREDNSDSVVLPAAVYEGRNVTCVFDHPKFIRQVSRVITLPSFYLSGVYLLHSELGSNSDDFQGPESLEVQEGQRDTVISLQVTGNVPHYNVACQKDDGPLPDGVELVGSSLTVQGPVEHRHAGLYECFFSYRHVNATLKFNVTVKPQVIRPVPPTIRVDLQTEGGHSVIECSAADAVPAASMSWLLPEGVSGVSWFNLTSHNGSHSVRGVLLLPACSPWELTAECVINHPALEEPENRSIALPLCARPKITINSSTEWKDGDEFTKVDCSVDSVAPAATISWHVGNVDNSISYQSQTEVQADGSVSARCSAHVLSSLYSGQNLTCTVKHPSLEAPEKRTIHILVHKAPLLSVSLVRRQDSPLWLAVCDCREEGVGADLSWVLPENANGQTSLHSKHEGRIKARLTYQFPLALHEGQDLTCVYRFEHGATEKKTIHVPRYHISSVRVLNHTSPLQNRYGGETIAHRLALQENLRNQRVLLRVEGNVPEYDLICKRSDGSFVQMDGVAMVFQSELTEQDEGLYCCRAFFYHHTATVNIQVEVTSEDEQLALAAIICISSALAVLLILVVTLWVCCKGNSSSQYKKKESLSALTSLMQEPGSPEVKKPAVTEINSKEITQLVSFSIVLDVKSTV